MSIFSISSSSGASFFAAIFLELIQIHADQIDGRNPVLRDGLHVLGLGAHRQNSAGNARMNGLHAAIQHLRKLGDLGHFAQRRDPGLLEHPISSAGRKHLDAQARKSAGKIHNSGLIGDADQSALNIVT